MMGVGKMRVDGHLSSARYRFHFRRNASAFGIYIMRSSKLEYILVGP